MDLKQAELKVKELTESVPLRIWCPLTANGCRTDCICYVEAYKMELRKDLKIDNYKVYGGTCGNSMFFNEE